MNLDNEFDELARRKLQEQAFPFEEAHWSQAEQVIAAQRGRKRRGFWWLGAAALLVVSTALWSTRRGPEPTEAVADTVAVTGESTAATTKRNAHNTADRPSTPSSSVPSTTSRSASTPPVHQSQEQHVSSVQDPVSTTQRSASTRSSVIAAPPPTVTTSIPVDQERTGSPEPSNSTAVPVVRANAGSPLPTRTAPTDSTIPMITVHDLGTPATQGDHTDPTLTTAATSSTNAAALATTTTADPLEMIHMTSAACEDTLIGVEQDPAIATAATTPHDSTLATPAVPVIPSIIAEHGPWEISVLGGAFSNGSTYHGGNSADWSGDRARLVDPGFGAELMHRGRNFGWGVGLHYGTYADRLRVDAIDRTDMERWSFWYLAPVDTTILLITDSTIQGGEVVYEGVNVNTTVHVLRQGADSARTTTRVRNARDLVIRTSYVEVPLLLDAHLVQGRWSVGLRGGPTVGLLTGRAGSIPNGTDDGYTELDDQAYRKVVFGWTARAYLRYRFNAAWSVGIEPAMRGLFSNSLGAGDVQRRSSAFGGWISLSYRLR